MTAPLHADHTTEHIIHLVSDSTGETVTKVSRAALAQFRNVRVKEYVWSFVHTPGQIDATVAQIAEEPGLVLFTVVEDSLRRQLIRGCEQQGLPYISVLGPLMHALQNHLEAERRNKPGRRHELNDEYFQRMEAIDFTVNHDDGQGLQDIADADVILTGISRMSKTPCSIYLAYRGVRTANVPLVLGIEPPLELFESANMQNPPLIVGLVQDENQLRLVRDQRLHQLTTEQPLDYVDPDKIREELLFSRRLFAKHQWPVVDVTRRSVEETAALVLQLLHANHDQHDVLV